MQGEHRHHHPDGVVFEAVYALSMLLGRGGMARTVAQLANLSPSDAVVDIGCGPGSAVRHARRVGAARAIGIDPSPQMLRLARWVTTARRVDGVDFVEGSAENLPLEATNATVVWAIQSVHHWEDRDQGLKEALRVLAPGGRLLLAERSVTAGARGHAAHGLTDQQADELARSAARAGFADVGVRRIRVGRRDFTAVTGVAAPSRGVPAR